MGSQNMEEALSREVEELRAQLAEANETLRAIREGEVDAVIVSGSKGDQVFSLVGADSIYRLIVETMKEAAFTVTVDGRILYGNARFGEFVKRPLEQILGRPLREFIEPANRPEADSLLALAPEQPVKKRLVFVDAAGRPVPTHVSANVLNQMDGMSICVVATDLTDLENSTEMIQKLRHQREALQSANRKLARAKASLQRAREELETRVGERTEDLRRQSEQLRVAAAQLNVAEQRERKRLACVLHDGLQQNIAAAKFRLGFLELSRDPEISRTVAEVMKILSESMEMSRSLTADLSPPALHEKGLVPALEWLAGLMETRQGLAVEVVARDKVERVPEDVCVTLYQATRELLFNALKHSGVKSARVQVDREGREARVMVSDEGNGFDASVLDAGQGQPSGFGLFSIRERLNLLGGKMRVESAPGRGSRFILKVPLDESLAEVSGERIGQAS